MHNALLHSPKLAALLMAQPSTGRTWQTSLSARTRLTMARQPLHCTPPELAHCFMALTMVATPSRSPTCARTCKTAHTAALHCTMPSPIMGNLGVEAKSIALQ